MLINEVAVSYNKDLHAELTLTDEHNKSITVILIKLLIMWWMTAQ